MQFLGKNPESSILTEQLTYTNNAANNQRLRALLLEEQRGFCAYTEKYAEELDSVEVEHFDSSLKYNDDYYNYYAVLRRANSYKKDELYQRLKTENNPRAAFFDSRFFQNSEAFRRRISYNKEQNIYLESDETDEEAAGLIDFLGFNDPSLYENRRKHLNRLNDIFQYFSRDERLTYLQNHLQECSFITAIEAKFDISLSF